MNHETTKVGVEVLSGSGAQGRQDFEAQDHAGAATHDAGRKKKVKIGSHFGRWTVVSDLGSDSRWRRIWKVACDCGVVGAVQGSRLINGHTKSCGCLKIALLTTHGMHGTPEYQAWLGALARCEYQTGPQYENYGGRGISVCDRWKCFESFYADMGPRPSPEHSLDRKNNNGNYCKENCRWATPSEQQRNRRNNRMLTFGGETKTIVEWSEVFGLRANTISTRLRRGWPHTRLMSRPQSKFKNQNQ